MRRLPSSELLARWGARLALLVLAGCVEPYVPAVIDAPNTFLVVDGFINGNGRSTFLLSRTTNVAVTATPPAEKGAQVFIMDDAGGRYPLREAMLGTYQSDSLVLDASRQYQLRITTSANVSYASDLVPLKITPPIDKLGWQADSSYVRVSLNTHDPSGQARYYRWGFIETWEFNAAFESIEEYDYTKKKIVPRVTPIYTCWQTKRSSLIKQGSSGQLSQDVLTNAPLLAISSRAERLKIRYSVLVSQYAETAPEFAYYELLRKNTEAVGTVNDPLPTQLTGNVHRVDQAAEPVLGYVGAHTVQQRRLFISRAELPLPKKFKFENPYQDCMYGGNFTEDYFKIYGTVPISFIGSSPLLYGSTRECADCRVRGSNVKPSFW